MFLFVVNFEQAYELKEARFSECVCASYNMYKNNRPSKNNSQSRIDILDCGFIRVKKRMYTTGGRCYVVAIGLKMQGD